MQTHKGNARESAKRNVNRQSLWLGFVKQRVFGFDNQCPSRVSHIHTVVKIETKQTKAQNKFNKILLIHFSSTVCTTWSATRRTSYFRSQGTFRKVNVCHCHKQQTSSSKYFGKYTINICAQATATICNQRREKRFENSFQQMAILPLLLCSSQKTRSLPLPHFAVSQRLWLTYPDKTCSICAHSPSPSPLLYN